VISGIRYAGAALVTLDQTIWAQALGHGASAQKAELITLTHCLRYGRDKIINVYTGSRYSFATAHVHRALYRKRGFLTSEGKNIKNAQEILALLEALWLPKKVVIIHCPGHQKGDHPEARGNRAADKAARTVTTKEVGPLKILLTHPPSSALMTKLYNTRLTIRTDPPANNKPLWMENFARWKNISSPFSGTHTHKGPS
jgi:ribonuclease HI